LRRSTGAPTRAVKRLALVAAAVVVVVVTSLPGIAQSAAVQTLPQAGALAGQPPAGPEAMVTYEPPVSAPVLDPFRAPTSPYGPGNRGIEYDTWPSQPVVAAADGTVTFAGSVGGSLHVTIAHADGVRTSYSFLASIDVARGQSIAQGGLVGRAGDVFHFGARIGTVYVDPAALFGAGPVVVALIPHDRPLSSTVRVGRAIPARGTRIVPAR
jgi:murein DD-endopeptidase MepM/ murein hydrolase activator NlpD